MTVGYDVFGLTVGHSRPTQTTDLKSLFEGKVPNIRNGNTTELNEKSDESSFITYEINEGNSESKQQENMRNMDQPGTESSVPLKEESILPTILPQPMYKVVEGTIVKFNTVS